MNPRLPALAALSNSSHIVRRFRIECPTGVWLKSVIMEERNHTNRDDQKHQDETKHRDNQATNVLLYEGVALGAVEVKFMDNFVSEISEEPGQLSCVGRRRSGAGWEGDVGETCA
jgi:hypothetical protein